VPRQELTAICEIMAETTMDQEDMTDYLEEKLTDLLGMYSIAETHLNIYGLIL